MTRGGLWFCGLLVLNALVTAGYLLWYLLFKKESDNRVQYLINGAVMLLCPVVGCLYLLLGYGKFRFLRFGKRDLSDVEFSKRRQAARVKADEEREQNVVSVEEAILVSDQEKKRTNMLNILLGETDESFSSIALALNSDDSEVAHYAASFLQSRMDEFREHVRRTQQAIRDGDPDDPDVQAQIIGLVAYMDQMLKQNVFTRVEQADYVIQMEKLVERLFRQAPNKVPAACYESVLARLLGLRAYERAERWAERYSAQYPDQLSGYTLRLKLCFETNQKERFFEVLDQLRASPVVVDNRTLELIRMIQR